MINLKELADTVSQVKIMFDPRDLLADPSLIDEPEFTNMMNIWRPILEQCEDILKELTVARKIIANYKEFNNGHSDRCDYPPCDCGYKEAQELLDEYDYVVRF